VRWRCLCSATEFLAKTPECPASRLPADAPEVVWEALIGATPKARRAPWGMAGFVPPGFGCAPTREAVGAHGVVIALGHRLWAPPGRHVRCGPGRLPYPTGTGRYLAFRTAVPPFSECQRRAARVPPSDGYGGGCETYRPLPSRRYLGRVLRSHIWEALWLE
jgi:hypothetical protein